MTQKQKTKQEPCQKCEGKSRKKTRPYFLNDVAIWLCDSCAFPLLYAQLKQISEKVGV